MSDRHLRRLGEDYGTAFLTLLPQGQAWPKSPGTTLDLACRGLAEYWGFVDSRAADLLERESDPRLTIELLEDWERNWGLPDPCYDAPQTIGERQQALVMRMTMEGSQSREFFIGVAAQIGYTITISEYRTFVVGLDRVGDNRVYGGLQPWPAWVGEQYGDAAPQVSFAADFQQGRYYVQGVGEVALTDILVLERDSAAVALDAAGAMHSFGSHTPARTDQGLQIQEARSNVIRNSILDGAVAGTPGTLPTHWAVNGLQGLAVNVAETGVVLGLPYIDIQFVGTPTSNTEPVSIQFDGAAAAAAAQGQSWALTVYAALVGGSLDNTTGHSIAINESDGVNWLTNSILGVGLNNTVTRFSFVHTLTEAPTAFVYGTLNIGLVVGQPVDVTIRIIAPQLELGAFGTPPIMTFGAPVSRVVDIPHLIGAAAVAGFASKSAFFQTLGGTYSNFNQLLDNSPAFSLEFASSTTIETSLSGGAPTVTATVGGGGSLAGVVKTALSSDASGHSVVANGGVKVADGPWEFDPGALMYLGNRADGTRALCGFMQRFALSSVKGAFDEMTAEGPPPPAAEGSPMYNDWGNPILNPRGVPVADGELSEWPYYGLGPPENRFYWTVHVDAAKLVWFRVTSGQTGVDPHLRIGVFDDLECLLNRWKPAHTVIIFDYSGLATGGDMAGTP